MTRIKGVPYKAQLKKLKKEFPNAKNILIGSNNICLGFWFEKGDNPKHRFFYLFE